MEYSKSGLTRFAKDCAYASNQITNGICIANEIRGNIFKNILDGDEALLLEVSRRFAKYSKDTVGFDVENGDVHDFQYLIEKIIECCEKNNWFKKER